MYETRQQAALHQDENKRAEIKAPKGTAGLGKALAAPAVNNRRALGDIGNLVGAAAHGNVAKDGQTELQNLEKKVPVPLPVVDRPVTRSLIAQLANNHISKEETNVDEGATKGISQKQLAKKQTDSTVESKDVDSNKVVVSKDVPPGHPARMKALLSGRNGRAAEGKERKRRTLTATLTARSEAACGGFKSEVVEEPLTNIDADDIGDQLAVVDYVEDIYSFYRKTEEQSCVPPDYMSRQVQINEKMRAILIDWLIEVHFKFKLMPETLFLTMNLIDRYLAIQPVERKNLQLVGMTAMLVASKYEEIWAPEIQDFIFISDNAYTRLQILDMEKGMLNALRFNLCIPTPYMFLVRFLKAASSDQQMNMLAFYFVELCMVDYKMVKFSPSMLAASAVYLARNTLKSNEEAHWNATLRRHSGYKESELIECASLIVALHQKAGNGDDAVHRKYSQAKFSSVALLSPPTIVAAPATEDHHHSK